MNTQEAAHVFALVQNVGSGHIFWKCLLFLKIKLVWQIDIIWKLEIHCNAHMRKVLSMTKMDQLPLLLSNYISWNLGLTGGNNLFHWLSGILSPIMKSVLSLVFVLSLQVYYLSKLPQHFRRRKFLRQMCFPEDSCSMIGMQTHAKSSFGH